MQWGEALVEALVDTTDDAVLGNDADGRVATWNRAAERIFGRGADDVTGTPFVDLFPPHLRVELLTVVATVAAGGRVHHFETEIVRCDGLPVPLSLSLCPVFDIGRDTPVASVVVARDITERRVAQARLAEVEEQVRDTEAQEQVGTWLWDVRTGTVQWSAELHRIHGVEPLDFGATLDAHLRLLAADDRRRVRAEMDEAVAGGRPFETRYRVRRTDGTVRDLHVRAQPALGSTGVVLGLRGVAQDVTDPD